MVQITNKHNGRFDIDTCDWPTIFGIAREQLLESAVDYALGLIDQMSDDERIALIAEHTEELGQRPISEALEASGLIYLAERGLEQSRLGCNFNLYFTSQAEVEAENERAADTRESNRRNSLSAIGVTDDTPLDEALALAARKAIAERRPRACHHLVPTGSTIAQLRAVIRKSQKA